MSHQGLSLAGPNSEPVGKGLGNAASWFPTLAAQKRMTVVLTPAGRIWHRDSRECGWNEMTQCHLERGRQASSGSGCSSSLRGSTEVDRR